MHGNFHEDQKRFTNDLSVERSALAEHVYSATFNLSGGIING